MRIVTTVPCAICGDKFIVYLYNSIRKTNEKCLPAWTKCKCGWLEIATSSLSLLVPDWKDYFAEDVDEIDENMSFEEAMEDVKKFVEETFGEKL